MSYYDLDDIIKDQQTIPCRFNVTVPNLGFLIDSPGTEIKKDSTVNLPVWLVRMLTLIPISSDSDTPFISPLPTREFSPKVINALKSDPINVDLKLLSTVYYPLARQWLQMVDSPALAEVLVDAFKARMSDVADMSANSTNSGVRDQSDFLYKLDSVENNIFKASHEAHKDLKEWLANSDSKSINKSSSNILSNPP